MASLGNLLTTMPYARVIRCGVTAQIAGVLLMAALLFTKMPLLVLVCLPLGALLILVGALAWVWGAIWGCE